ncbi:MAG TPA: efflux RND transporter permease subunit [Pyrinomonadaceae bacterium]
MIGFAQLVSKQRRSVIVVMLLLCFGGLYAALQLPTAIFPDTDFPRIVITVENGEVPADQMLLTVTQPIEEAMNGLPGITRIKSTTARGSAEINLFFDWSTDPKESLGLVQARLPEITLPPTANITHVERLTFAVFPVSGYSLTSDKRDVNSLRDIATYTVRPQLARLNGVASVTIQGGNLREMHVEIDPVRLASRQITIQQVTDALKNSNILASPGLMTENHQLELALVSGQAITPQELAATVVANVNGNNILISDIANVTEGTPPNYTIVTADGKPSVLVNVLRQPNANTVAVTDEVKAELDALKTTLPKDVVIAPFYDQSLLVRESIASVRDAIILGLILSVAILFLFLRDFGTTFVAILVIPVTILVTFLAMYLIGLAFNLMTLGGVAAAIGLVIDDAIVVVENIHTHILRGEGRVRAVHLAVSEITLPIIGSTITPVVVFLPLAFLTGITGVFFRSLALTMSVALLTSLVLALTFTPILAEKFIRSKDARDHEEVGPVLAFIMRPYEWLLRASLAHRLIVPLIAVVVILGSLLLYKQLGSEFLPAFDEGAFVLDYIAPAGTSLDETDRMLKNVEEMIKATPEVESYSRRTGLQLGLSITEPNTGDFLVKLKQGHARSTDDVINDLRDQIQMAQPALDVEFVGILSDLIGDLTSSPEPIQIVLYSEDKAALEAKAEEVEASIQKVDGIVDTNPGVIVSGPAVTFKVDPQAAAKMGVNANDIATAIETVMSGNVVSTVISRGRPLVVRVMFPHDAANSVESLKSLPLRSSTGAMFRLDQIATVAYDKGQTEINREGLRQNVAVTARISGSDLGTAVNAVKANLAQNVRFPPGMTVEYAGLYAEQQASFRELIAALAVAIVLVFLVLLVEFRSFAHPVAIVAGAVLALAGVLLALFITGSTLNVVSLMGMIMVVGIVAKNGILMLDAVEDNLAKTGDLTEALLLSGRRRFRPVLMTSLAAILGMLPLALAIGSGSELLQPLAIAVIGGLLFALVLSLVVTPTVFAVMTGKRVTVSQEDASEA